MTTKAAPEFWKSSGFHLLNRNADGWLTVTPDFLRAYLTRPEVHPIDTSCDNEITLFESLMGKPRTRRWRRPTQRTGRPGRR